MNRELFLSLGITLLVSTTLFLYFRHRFKVVEHKVNTIFQLVQSHAQPRPRQQYSPQRSTAPTNEILHPHAQMAPGYSTKSLNPTELIDVSDDEFSDSGEETDSDEESVASKNITFPNDIKQISVTLGSEINRPTAVNMEEKISDLDDVASLSDDEKSVVSDTPSLPAPPLPLSSVDYTKLTVAKLKDIAAEKGFNNISKLRKQGLVDLLSE